MNYKRIFQLVLLLLSINFFALQAQNSRTTQTIVADVLAQMPAKNQADYNKQIGDLASTGEEGILILAKMLKAPGLGSNAKVEYALSGLINYVSGLKNEQTKQTAINAFQKAVAATSIPEIRTFLQTQLQTLGTGYEPAKAAEEILPKVTKNSPVHLRIAALRKEIQQVAGNEKKVAKKALEALKDPSAEYRNSALNFASPFAGKEIYIELAKTIQKAKPDVQTEILNWFGRESKSPEKNERIKNLKINSKLTFNQVLAELLKSKNPDVKEASAWTMVKIGDASAIPQLTGLLTSSSPQDIKLGKETLMSFKGYVSSAVEQVTDYASCERKVASIDIPALREEGFVAIFNGKDLTGWKGLVENPIARAKMTPAQLEIAQEKADEQMRKDWKVENGLLVFDGTGYDNLCTVKQYDDFEMYIDWLLDPSGKEADAGIYLRGTPQVQIWDTARVSAGAQVGSGGLYNNQTNESKPLKAADNAMGEWNTFYIKMIGDRVTVYLNGELVTDNIILENYWDRKQPVFPIEQIELQAHGSKVYYRNIYVKELKRPEPFALSPEEKNEGFKILFDGTNMYEWTGNTKDYTLKDGTITLVPSVGSGGNLYTKSEYDDFIFRFEFMLTPGANNGLGIRTPMEGDPAYVGMELQILDNEDPIYNDLQAYQYHGSVYGIIPAKRGFLKPTGEWNTQEVIAKGDNIKITLNGEVILDGNIREAVKNGTPDQQNHPGLFNKKGYIGFLGHGSEVKFRNIRIKELK